MLKTNTHTQNIYLIRHGESEQNIASKSNIARPGYIPDHAIALTETGKNQAHLAGHFLTHSVKINNLRNNNTALFASPFRRTRETRNEILKFIQPCIIHEDSMLIEMQFGLFDGVPKSLVKKLYPDQWARYRQQRAQNGKFYACRPDGESPLDVEVRQRLFLSKMEDTLKDTNIEHVIIVGHGAQLTALRKAMFNYTPEWYEKEPNPQNTSIQLVTCTDGVMMDCGYIYRGPESE